MRVVPTEGRGVTWDMPRSFSKRGGMVGSLIQVGMVKAEVIKLEGMPACEYFIPVCEFTPVDEFTPVATCIAPSLQARKRRPRRSQLLR